MKKILSTLWFLITVYFICPPICTIVLFLWICGRLEIVGWKNKKLMYHLKREHQRGVLVISNHPSFWLEPFIIPIILFASKLFKNPFQEFPWSLPDKINFSKGWLFFIQGMRFLMVSRNNLREIPEVMRSFGEKICQLKMNGIVHPEGGRTTTRKESDIVEKNGMRMGRFKDGYLAAIKRGCENENGKPPIIVPILVEGSDKILPPGKSLPDFRKSKIRITIGSPILVDKPTSPEISPESVQQNIFDLSSKKPA